MRTKGVNNKSVSNWKSVNGGTSKGMPFRKNELYLLTAEKTLPMPIKTIHNKNQKVDLFLITNHHYNHNKRTVLCQHTGPFLCIVGLMTNKKERHTGCSLHSSPSVTRKSQLFIEMRSVAKNLKWFDAMHHKLRQSLVNFRCAKWFELPRKMCRKALFTPSGKSRQSQIMP